MAHEQIDLGIVGLGHMGGNLALQALEKGFKVAGYTRGEIDPSLTAAGLRLAGSAPELAALLAPVRVVLLYLPAGPAVDAVLAELEPTLQPGDIVADCGNSYWGDSIRRHRRLKHRGVQYLDVGTSGGPEGARHGACFMVGGESDAVAHTAEMFKSLAVTGGYVHAGPPGAGHFIKLVHNGIEFGMLQAIGEGIGLLENYHEALDVPGILTCWRNGSVIRSWLLELLHAAYEQESGMDRVPPCVEDTGEVNWLVDDALRMEVPIPVITQSVVQLLVSRDDERKWARAIAMMRHGFGGHPYGRDESIARLRRTSKVGKTFDPDTGD